jgi:hypothetical protein
MKSIPILLTDGAECGYKAFSGFSLFPRLGQGDKSRLAFELFGAGLFFRLVVTSLPQIERPTRV